MIILFYKVKKFRELKIAETADKIIDKIIVVIVFLCLWIYSVRCRLIGDLLRGKISFVLI